MQKNVLSVSETAEYVGLSATHLNILRSRRPADSPPYYKLGSRVVYPVKELDQWLAARLVK
jgi:predicted DNA-binding transcriptional regulator AlpA